jgi:hypothetical protein
MSTIEISTRFEIIACVECGISFWVPLDFMGVCRRSPRTLWCPNGHEQDADKNDVPEITAMLAEQKLSNAIADHEGQFQALKAHYDEQAEAREAEIAQLRQQVKASPRGRRKGGV